LLPTSSDQPEDPGRATPFALLFGLAPDGVYLAIPVTRDTGGLLPRHFTLTTPAAWRYLFCGTFLLVAETGRYPASCPMEPGLSSRHAGSMASDHLIHFHSVSKKFGVWSNEFGVKTNSSELRTNYSELKRPRISFIKPFTKTFFGWPHWPSGPLPGFALLGYELYHTLKISAKDLEPDGKRGPILDS
jgi:hypothetical protein